MRILLSRLRVLPWPSIGPLQGGTRKLMWIPNGFPGREHASFLHWGMACSGGRAERVSRRCPESLSLGAALSVLRLPPIARATVALNRTLALRGRPLPPIARKQLAIILRKLMWGAADQRRIGPLTRPAVHGAFELFLRGRHVSWVMCVTEGRWLRRASHCVPGRLACLHCGPLGLWPIRVRNFRDVSVYPQSLNPRAFEEARKPVLTEGLLGVNQLSPKSGSSWVGKF
jgi:hypothetical protein